MAKRSRFELLALPHRNAAFSLAYWIVRSRDDAEDVVQDAYLQAYRAFDGFRGEAMRPWLLAIVRNAAYRHLHGRKRAGNVISFEDAFRTSDMDTTPHVASEDPSAELQLIAEGERRQLYEALGELSLPYRDIIILRELEGLSYGEIAEIAGIPIGTVMSRLSRGRAELRTALARRRAKDEPEAL